MFPQRKEAEQNAVATVAKFPDFLMREKRICKILTTSLRPESRHTPRDTKSDVTLVGIRIRFEEEARKLQISEQDDQEWQR